METINIAPLSMHPDARPTQYRLNDGVIEVRTWNVARGMYNQWDVSSASRIIGVNAWEVLKSKAIS